MNVSYRLTVTTVACVFGFALACSGKTTGGSGSSSSACDDYFDAMFALGCPGTHVPPASDLAGMQSRFDTVCNAAISLPGSGITEASLEACVAAIKSGGCAVGAESSGPCAFDTGTLSAGATCVSNWQCESGYCTTEEVAPDGGMSACGTCKAAATAGQSCDATPCGPGLVCTFGSTGTEACVAMTSVGEGSACDVAGAQCNQGLYCNDGTCAATLAAGALCQSEDACTQPLVCPMQAGAASTCQGAGQLGAPCGGDQDCAASLACSQSRCATVTWVSAGQPCSDTAYCLVGDCPFNGTTAAGTCPTVIPDGQPCNANDPTQTCDTFASCIGGTCVLGEPTCP